eukprot:542941_1
MNCLLNFCFLYFRVFIFDCCEGIEGIKSVKTKRKNKTKITTGIGEEKSKNSESKEIENKIEEIKHKQHETQLSFQSEDDDESLWRREDHNPDNLLAVLNAANADFQSVLNTYKGSYLICSFVEKAKERVRDNALPFLGTIFKQIQDELGEFKQLPTYTWNNNTECITLKVRENSMNKSNVETEKCANLPGNKLEIANMAMTHPQVVVDSNEIGVNKLEDTELEEGMINKKYSSIKVLKIGWKVKCI